MKTIAIALISILATSSAFSAPKKAAKKVEAPAIELSLKEAAEKEVRTPGAPIVKKSRSSEVQIEATLLKLKDPKPEVVGRNFKYTSTFKINRWAPKGNTSIASSVVYDLSDSGSTWLPSLSLGFDSPNKEVSFGNLSLGADAELGYSTQKVDTTLATGFRIRENRLNSTLLSAGPSLSAKFNNLEKMSFKISPRLGSTNYTQAGVTSAASFSKRADFAALAVAAAYAVDSNMQLALESQFNRNLGQSTVKIQNNTISLGANIIW
jgi:hypothetical protein